MSTCSRLHENRSIIFHSNDIPDAAQPTVKENGSEVSWPGIAGGFHPKSDGSGRRVKFRMSCDSDLGEREIETHQTAASAIGGNPGCALVGCRIARSTGIHHDVIYRGGGEV